MSAQYPSLSETRGCLPEYVGRRKQASELHERQSPRSGYSERAASLIDPKRQVHDYRLRTADDMPGPNEAHRSISSQLLRNTRPFPPTRPQSSCVAGSRSAPSPVPTEASSRSLVSHLRRCVCFTPAVFPVASFIMLAKSMILVSRPDAKLNSAPMACS